MRIGQAFCYAATFASLVIGSIALLYIQVDGAFPEADQYPTTLGPNVGTESAVLDDTYEVRKFPNIQSAEELNQALEGSRLICQTRLEENTIQFQQRMTEITGQMRLGERNAKAKLFAADPGLLEALEKAESAQEKKQLTNLAAIPAAKEYLDQVKILRERALHDEGLAKENHARKDLLAREIYNIEVQSANESYNRLKSHKLDHLKSTGTLVSVGSFFYQKIWTLGPSKAWASKVTIGMSID